MDQEKTLFKKYRKAIITIGVIVVVIVGYTALTFYLRYFTANVTAKQQYLFIRTGENYNDVFKYIQDEEIVKDAGSFDAAAEGMHYKTRVKPGRYRLHEGM